MSTSASDYRSDLDRREVVKTLLDRRGDALVITGLGSSTYDVAAAGDQPRNFYLWGAMGGAAALALGVALAQPDVPVIAVTGDGEMLMGMGTFSTIAVQQPKNLSIIVLDNSLYGETGSQHSHTVRTDLAATAKACGIDDVRTARSIVDVELLASQVCSIGGGPRVAVIKIGTDTPSRVVPLREGAHAKSRFREALGFPVD